MIYIKAVEKAHFVKGTKIPKNAKYVRVNKEGYVWRAHNPMFYSIKPINSKEL